MNINSKTTHSTIEKIAAECIVSFLMGAGLCGSIILLGIVCHTIKFLFIFGWRIL
jgi:hypothetical protein